MKLHLYAFCGGSRLIEQNLQKIRKLPAANWQRQLRQYIASNSGQQKLVFRVAEGANALKLLC